MSVSELLTTDINSKKWSNLYVNSLTANNLNFDNVTVDDLTVNGTLTMNAEAASSAPYFDAQKRLSSSILTNGQLMIGSSGNPPFANSLTGTTDQVNISNGSGSITLSLPQSIATTSSPTFSSLSLTTQDLVIADNNLSVQSIANAVATPATFVNVSTTGTNITYNAGTFTVNKTGIYLVTYDMTYAANATGYRQTIISVTSAGYSFPSRATTETPGNAAVPVYQTGSEVLKLSSGDSFVIQMFQTSGGNLNSNVAGIVTVYRLS